MYPTSPRIKNPQANKKVLALQKAQIEDPISGDTRIEFYHKRENQRPK